MEGCGKGENKWCHKRERVREVQWKLEIKQKEMRRRDQGRWEQNMTNESKSRVPGVGRTRHAAGREIRCDSTAQILHLQILHLVCCHSNWLQLPDLNEFSTSVLRLRASLPQERNELPSTNKLCDVWGLNLLSIRAEGFAQLNSPPSFQRGTSNCCRLICWLLK